MKFDVVVATQSGQEERKVITANDRFAVYAQLEKEHVTVLALEEHEGIDFSAWKGALPFTETLSALDTITFIKNLASMLAAGLTLSRALSVIERQSTNPFLTKIVGSLEEDVRGGMSFHEALERHPHLFSKLLVAMVRVGEESGTLASSLSVIAKQMENMHALTKRVRGAMIYPSIILGAVGIIAFLMLVYVVPTLSATFASLNVELPLMTRVVVGFSDFLVANALLVALALGISAAAFVWYSRTSSGSRLLLDVALRIPVVGTLVQETFNARAARTLSSLLTSGVEMLNALQITQEVVGANKFGDVVGEAMNRVQKGEQLSAVFGEYPRLYPVFFSDMIAVGEETGNVAHLLDQVAEVYEANVAEGTKDLSTIIEPLLMLLIGGAVGIFALAMIAPIYSLSDSI